MAADYWNHSKYIQYKVRDFVRRGWLLKTYTEEKLLQARIKTGEKNENDKIDIIQPVGFSAHVKASGKHEVMTLDPNGDPSRRVIWMVIGDREFHPKPDENETFIYSPDEPKMHLRLKKKRDQQERANGKDSSGNEDSGREAGMHWDGLEERVTGTTKSSFSNNADKGQGLTANDGNLTVKVGHNTQFEAQKHIRRGETHRDSQMFVNGIVHAADHYAGGGTSISSPQSRADQREDGTQDWSASGRGGNVSLLRTAEKVGTMGGMMGALTGILGAVQQNQQGNQSSQQNEDMERRLRELEELLAQLQEQMNGPG